MNLHVTFELNLKLHADLIANVTSYKTDHGELHIFQNGSQRPSVIFAARQWISAAVSDDLSALDASPAVPEVVHRPLAEKPNPRKSDLRDLSLPTPDSISSSRAASVQFAIDNQTVPWSEAHMRALLKYESDLRTEYGDDVIDRLPWHQIPRGADAKKRMESP